MGTPSPSARSLSCFSDVCFCFPGVEGYPSDRGSIIWRRFDGERPYNVFLAEVDAVVAERLLAQACHEVV